MNTKLLAFARDRRGVAALEFTLLAPVLLALLLGSITIFDLFRTAQKVEKATFTVGDILSRQTSINSTTMGDMLELVHQTVAAAAGIRVSSISMTQGRLVLDWTRSVGTGAGATAIPFNIVPDLANGDSIILTESFVPHRAFVSGFGVDEVSYENKVVHRPRFVGRISFAD